MLLFNLSNAFSVDPRLFKRQCVTEKVMKYDTLGPYPGVNINIHGEMYVVHMIPILVDLWVLLGLCCVTLGSADTKIELQVFDGVWGRSVPLKESRSASL